MTFAQGNTDDAPRRADTEMIVGCWLAPFARATLYAIPLAAWLAPDHGPGDCPNAMVPLQGDRTNRKAPPMKVTLSVITRPWPGTWTVTIVVVLIVVIAYRWAGPGWALPLGLGGWLARLGYTRTLPAVAGEER